MPTNEELVAELTERLDKQDARHKELEEELAKLRAKKDDDERPVRGKDRIARGFEKARAAAEDGGKS